MTRGEVDVRGRHPFGLLRGVGPDRRARGQLLPRLQPPLRRGKRGASEEEAERRAWATVNKSSGGGKKSGSGKGKKENKGPAKKGGKKGGKASKGGAKKGGSKKGGSKKGGSKKGS